MIPASQSGAGTANLITFSSLWLEHDCHARVAQLCTGRYSSNLSLLEPTLCTSLSYSSAMTLRRASVFCGNRLPLAPHQVLLAFYGMTASVMNYSYSLA